MAYRINLRSILDYNYVEAYLNKMARQGYELKDFSLYSLTFKKSQTSNFKYKVIYIDKDGLVSKNEMTTLFEDSGWTLVSDKRYYKLDTLIFKSDKSLNLDGVSDLDSEVVMLEQLQDKLLTKWSLFVLVVDILVLLSIVILQESSPFFWWHYLTLVIFTFLVLEGLNRIRLYFKYKDISKR